MTTFNKGDRVQSNVDAQNMRVGEEFLVTGRDVQYTPFGDYVAYELYGPLSDADGRAVDESKRSFRYVRNGHLVLTQV